jgi:hypothetical protein
MNQNNMITQKGERINDSITPFYYPNIPPKKPVVPLSFFSASAIYCCPLASLSAILMDQIRIKEIYLGWLMFRLRTKYYWYQKWEWKLCDDVIRDDMIQGLYCNLQAIIRKLRKQTNAAKTLHTK